MNVERAFWGLRFRVRFLESTGDEFQTMIRQLMTLRFPDEFVAVKPAGRDGDWKNDGLLTSQRRLLQVYAPESFDKRKTIAKIQDDHSGAVEHWSDLFDTWTFVHNSDKGLPPYATAELEERSRAHERIQCDQWGYPMLRQLTVELDDGSLTEFLGAPVRHADLLATEVQDVIPLLRSIETSSPIALEKVRPVPPDKLEKNMLSEDAAGLLLLGMRRSDEVRKYLDGQTQRPTFRDDLGARFRAQYAALKEVGLEPDDVLAALIEWVAGTRLAPRQQAAALAVVAFFFEECDIFEDPSKEGRA